MQEARFHMVLEDSGVLAECSIQVLMEDEYANIADGMFEQSFESSVVIARTIIQSEALHEAFSELYDLPSAATVDIVVSSSDDMNSPHDSSVCFSLRATSETGSCEIDFQRASNAFIEFHATKSISSTFHLAVLQQAMQVLPHAVETFLRLNEQGFFSIQHMLVLGNKRAFIDALVCPDAV